MDSYAGRSCRHWFAAGRVTGQFSNSLNPWSDSQPDKTPLGHPFTSLIQFNWEFNVCQARHEFAQESSEIVPLGRLNFAAAKRTKPDSRFGSNGRKAVR